MSHWQDKNDVFVICPVSTEEIAFKIGAIKFQGLNIGLNVRAFDNVNPCIKFHASPIVLVLCLRYNGDSYVRPAGL